MWGTVSIYTPSPGIETPIPQSHLYNRNPVKVRQHRCIEIFNSMILSNRKGKFLSSLWTDFSKLHPFSVKDLKGQHLFMLLQNSSAHKDLK